VEIVARRDAHAAGQRHYYTGKPCKWGHIGPRFVVNGNCVACLNFKIIPAMTAPNTMMPPTPYVLPSTMRPSPDMASYVHSRVLRDMVPKAAMEFERLRPGLKLDPTVQPHHVAAAVLHARDAEAQAARRDLLGAGWTDAMVDSLLERLA
jgi:hypothetical protein